ncbi:MAG TPA: MgtC/SapB family protein [Anaerolineaceae bacterium]|nr:MgtC/SapB family protein [Anaerolineaceae bacterium]
MIAEKDIIIRLAVSLVLGALVGYERERDSQPAGLRTHMILTLGACLAMVLSVNISAIHNTDPTRLAAQVISGIGFLGAGAILRYGLNIKGLTTATSLWTMAVVGLAVGYGYYLIGIVTTVMMLVTLTVVNIIENRFIRSVSMHSIVIEIRDSGSTLRQVRKAIAESAEQIRTFGIRHSLKNDQLRLESIAKIPKGERLEKLVETISHIEGVRSIKIE